MSTGLPAAPTSVPPPVPTAPATPASSVEVVTQLGTSVVSIDHLGVGAARSGRGRACLGVGAALLAGSLITFGAGVMSARDDAKARDAWLAKGKPAWAYRPHKSSGAADVAALGGALAGLGLVATGLLRRRDQARNSMRIGQNGDIPLAGAPDLMLVDGDAQNGYRANLLGLTGEVRRGNNVVSIESMIAAGHGSVPLAVGTHVKATLGKTTFHVRGVETPARTAAPSPIMADRNVMGFVAASAVVHIGLLAILNAVPPSQDTAALDMNVDENAGVMATLIGFEDPPPPPTEDGDDGENGENGAASEISATSMSLGTLGTDEPNPTPGKLSVANRNVDPQLARRMAIEAATNAGVLAAIQSPISVLEGGSIASGFEDIDITGGIIDGGGTGAPMGSFGWGVRGQGLGCGTPDGKNCQGVHAGPYATIGWEGKDYGGPFGQRPGRPGGPGGRVAKAPKVIMSTPVACTADAPCLDKEIIRRYVKRNIEKITYCYEKELLGDPSLEGTVTAFFTLNGNGRVIESKATGVSDTVSSCIAGVVANIHFPKVGETGIYPIKYPFALRPAGK